MNRLEVELGKHLTENPSTGGLTDEQVSDFLKVYDEQVGRLGQLCGPLLGSFVPVAF
jgi:hypothetical protein